MARIKRLINFGLPVSACNMRCPYCYVSQVGWDTKELGTLDYPTEHIQRCLTVERLGGICHISLCGSGETLLPQYTLDLAERFLENGHYISIVTNGTISKKIQELCNFKTEYKSRLFIKFSLHYLELKRLNLLDIFFKNVKLVKSNGISFTLELAAADEYLPYVNEIKSICDKKIGSSPHVVELRKQHDTDHYNRLTKLAIQEHIDGFQVLDSNIYNFQQEFWGEKRKEFCYAGEWIMQLDGKRGWFSPCFIGGNHIQNVYENPDEPIHFAAIGCNCPWQHCYSAYVLLASGAIPSIKTPTYAYFRDGISLDGSSWLQPKVHEFFSSQFIQSSQEYSKDKKCYINALMAMQYRNREYKWDTKRIVAILEKSLKEKNIQTVALWGGNLYTDWLLMHLMQTSIEVKYIVNDEKKLYRKKNKLKTGIPVVLGIDDKLDRADALIITNYPFIDSIKSKVPLVYAHILSLVDLVD